MAFPARQVTRRPRRAQLTELTRLWATRATGVVQSPAGSARLIQGEALASRDLEMLEATLQQDRLEFRGSEVFGEPPPPRLGAVLFAAARRLEVTLEPTAQLKPQEHAERARELPLSPATLHWLRKPPYHLSELGSLYSAQQETVSAEIAAVVALGLFSVRSSPPAELALSRRREVLSLSMEDADAGRWHEAVERLRRSSRYDAQALAWLGWCVWNDPSFPEEGRRKRARELLRRAESLGTSKGDAELLLALVAREEGRTDEAMERVRRLLDEVPRHLRGRRLLEQLRGQR